MFGLSANNKQKKAANRISQVIQRQIHNAVHVDSANASARVVSAFTVGYVYGLIRQGFTQQGFQGEDLAEKHFKPVCKKIPGNFYKVMLGQYEKLDHAMKHDNEEQVVLYEMGLEAGIHDAASLTTAQKSEANNLHNYLLNQSLNINTMPE